MKRDNFTAFGNTLHNAMQKTAMANSSVVMELGIINSDLSLTTDNYTQPIPIGSYMVNIHLTYKHGFTTENSNAHEHKVNARVLQSGDRVLVARVGMERVVIAIVTDSKNI